MKESGGEESEVEEGGVDESEREIWVRLRQKEVNKRRTFHILVITLSREHLPATIFYPCPPNHRSQEGLFIGQKMPRYGHVPFPILTSPPHS